ncbi:prepilin-type N-terminal cleavage/methylation domain-containing protein [Opitutaceae bacterium TAV1]|nr:prepilin-type N-terminal cleavage/methylation domain-containing protein [Opitutaceae bacterium TAV1]
MKATLLPPHPPPSGAARRGFTLIELLTVITIIGILAAILIPTVSKVRQSARKSTCISRLRQLGGVFQLYANDNKGRMIKPGTAKAGYRWPYHIAPYIGPYEIRYDNGVVDGLLHGAANNYYQSPVLRDPSMEAITSGVGIFGYNTNLDSDHLGDRFITVESLPNPSRLPILSTPGAGLQMDPAGPGQKAVEYGFPSGKTRYNGPGPNYGRRAIFLFADGHVEARDICNEDAWPWRAEDADVFKIE